MRLLDDQIDDFFHEGFVIQGDVFTPAEVAEMQAAFERLEALAQRLGATCDHDGSRFIVESVEGTPKVRIHRIVWCGGAEPTLSGYGRDPRLLTMAAQLLGSDRMEQLINQAHFKLPGDGIAFPWHQDSTHRRYGTEWEDVNGRGSYVQTVTAVDDVTEENGPLLLLPGSQRFGHLGPLDEGLPDGFSEDDAVAATMTAGSVLLMGPYTLHASRVNRSSLPRRAFINGFAYPGANSRDYPGCEAGRMVISPSMD